MSISAVSANNFCHNVPQNLLSGPKKTQEPFTLPDQTPIPGHPVSTPVQVAGTQPTSMSGDPLYNVLAGLSGTSALQGSPQFNVLSETLPVLP